MSSSAGGGGAAGGGGSGGGGGYGEKTYWDSRYAQEERYDWYLSYPQFKEQLIPHLRVQDCASPSAAAAASSASSSLRPRSALRCLIVGCGNSELSASMVDDGFTQLQSVDYSAVVIDKMREQHRDRADLRFTVMDVRDMHSFHDHAFDAIIDKSQQMQQQQQQQATITAARFTHVSPALPALRSLLPCCCCSQGDPRRCAGIDRQQLVRQPLTSAALLLPRCVCVQGTLDAILCGQESSKHAASMLSECHRLLAEADDSEQEGGGGGSGGVLIIITYGQPTSRLSYLEQSRYSWDVTYEVLGGTRYMYVMRKRRQQTPSKSLAGSGA